MTEKEEKQKPASELPFEGMDAWRHVAPLPGNGKGASVSEAAALILGILAMCIHWVVFFRWGLFLFVIPMILSVLAIVFGFVSAHRLFRKGHVRAGGEGGAGLTGLALGIMALMFTIAWLVIAQTFLWGWKL